MEVIKASRPQFRNEYDAVVAILHLTMCEVGFRCTGLAEQTSNNNVEVEKSLPAGWNSSPDSYSFQYKHTQSAMTFFVKFLVMGDKLLVFGTSREDNKICSLELSAKDYTNEKSLSNYATLYKDLDKLTALFRINISSKLLPSLNKSGYDANTPDANQTANTSNIEEHQAVHHTFPPVANDPLRMSSIGGRTGQFPSFGVGFEDIYTSIPGLGVPPGTRGNLVGPNHPSFGPRVGDPYSNFPFGEERMPRGTMPRARFDPLGPPPSPNSFFPPRRNNSNFGDELPPPSYDNMYL